MTPVESTSKSGVMSVREMWIDALVGAYSSVPEFQRLARNRLNAAADDVLDYPFRLLFPLFEAWRFATEEAEAAS